MTDVSLTTERVIWTTRAGMPGQGFQGVPALRAAQTYVGPWVETESFGLLASGQSSGSAILLLDVSDDGSTVAGTRTAPIGAGSGANVRLGSGAPWGRVRLTALADLATFSLSLTSSPVASADYLDARYEATSTAEAAMASLIDKLAPTSFWRAFKVNQGVPVAAASGGQTLVEPVLYVRTTRGYPDAGRLIVPTAAGGHQVLTYTGRTAGAFTGCSGGVGTVAAGAIVQLVEGTAAVSTTSGGHTLPLATITLTDAQAVPSLGTALFLSSTGYQLVTYTSVLINGNQTILRGCTGGTGRLTAGTKVWFPVCSTIHQAQTTAGASQGLYAGPNQWVQILVDPGTYNESWTPTPFTALVGSTGTKADVIIKQTGTAAGANVAHTAYAQGVTFLCAGTGATNLAAAFLTSLAATIGGHITPYTFIAVNCGFVSTNPNQYACFTSGPTGCFTGFFFCSFFQGAPGNTNYPCEFESAPSPRVRPSTTVCYSCQVTYTHQDNSALAPVHFFGQGNGQPDSFIWVTGPTGFIQESPGWSQVFCGQAAVPNVPYFYIDPAVAEIVTNTATRSTLLVTRSVVDPLPLPIGGLNDTTRNAYLPDQRYQARSLWVPEGNISTASPVANLAYYVPLLITAALRWADVLTWVTSAAGDLWVGVYATKTTKPGSRLAVSANGTLAVVGRNSIAMNTPAGKLPPVSFPYQVRVFLCVAANTAAVVMRGSTGMMTPVYSQALGTAFAHLPTTATPVLLSSATFVPSIGVVTS